MKRNESRNETSEKRNDANDNNRKRKSETKNQSQVHNKKAKTLEADKNVSYEKAKGMVQRSGGSTVLFAEHETCDSLSRMIFFRFLARTKKKKGDRRWQDKKKIIRVRETQCVACFDPF